MMRRLLVIITLCCVMTTYMVTVVNAKESEHPPESSVNRDIAQTGEGNIIIYNTPNDSNSILWYVLGCVAACGGGAGFAGFYNKRKYRTRSSQKNLKE